VNIYVKKQLWKISLLLGALGIALSSLFYTNSIVDKLAEEENKKVKLVAEATKRSVEDDGTGDLTFYFKIIKDNNTVPVIWVDEHGLILNSRNLDSIKIADQPGYLESKLIEMKAENQPVEIPIGLGSKQYIYFENSILISLLAYYPYMQLSIIGLFVIISYFAFSSSRNAEQNQVWVGMSKETAHQLGTPLSSLMGWIEYLKSIDVDDSIVEEIRKDVTRLETITDRFSKIGSDPSYDEVNLLDTINHVVSYLRTRLSSKVEIIIEGDETINSKVCIPLFEWVIENITKNAVDAMSGEGKIEMTLFRLNEQIIIDISDTGKGIPKQEFKKIFKPGFTSKKRGWGLGLSLVKRIIEDHHEGRVFVKNSELSKGTVFRIEL
jgi:hypothetical protein